MSPVLPASWLRDRTVAADVVLRAVGGVSADGDARHDFTTCQLRHLFDQIASRAEGGFEEALDVRQEAGSDRVSARELEAGFGGLSGFTVEWGFFGESEADAQVVGVVGFGFGVDDFGLDDGDSVLTRFNAGEGGVNFGEVDAG